MWYCYPATCVVIRYCAIRNLKSVFRKHSPSLFVEMTEKPMTLIIVVLCNATLLPFYLKLTGNISTKVYINSISKDTSGTGRIRTQCLSQISKGIIDKHILKITKLQMIIRVSNSCAFTELKKLDTQKC